MMRRSFGLLLAVAFPWPASTSWRLSATNRNVRAAPVCCSAAEPQAPPHLPAAMGATASSVPAAERRSQNAGSVRRRRQSTPAPSDHPKAAPSKASTQLAPSATATASRSPKQASDDAQPPSSGGGGAQRSSGANRGRGGRGRATTGSPPPASAAVPTASRSAGAGTGGGGRRARRGGGTERRGSVRREAKRALTDFVRDLEPRRLLEHSEEITLARQVQRLKELEEIYSELIAQRTAAAQAPAPQHELQPSQQPHKQAPLYATSAEAVIAEGGASRGEWAAAANVSVAELRVQLREGRLARERIVMSNMGLVGNLVQQLKRASGGRLDHGITEADLVQEGCISLLRAAERFDVSMGVRFGTYATFWAKAAIRHALHEQSRVVRLPARVHHTFSKIKRATDSLANQSPDSDTVTDAQVSAELAAGGVKLSPQKIRQVIEQVKVRPSSLDARLKDDAGATVLDVIIDDTTRIEADVVQSMLQQDLSALMRNHLRVEEAQVLTLRFGLDDGCARTIRQVGDEIGIPYATTKHLLFSALSKMRKPHVARSLRDYLGGSDGGLDAL